MNKEEIIRRHFHGETDESWNEIKDTYPYSEIPFIVDHAIKESLEEYSEEEYENVAVALLEAIWISRWQGPDALVAVLEPEEAEQIVINIHQELAKIGYEIKRKDNFYNGKNIPVRSSGTNYGYYDDITPKKDE